jgi:hypothetical protein
VQDPFRIEIHKYYLQHFESLYIRYNTNANVVNGLKNDSPHEFIVEVILKINVV